MHHRDLDRIKTFNRRTALLAGGKLVLLSALVGRLYYLQVLQSDRYTMLADDNRINLRLLPPPRGRILDRLGELLAANRLNYRVVLISEQTSSVEETLDALSKLIAIGDHEILARTTLVAREFANHPTIGVDLDLAVAGTAAQHDVVGLLHPALADAKVGKFEQSFPGKLFFRDRGDVTGHMRRHWARGVMAALADVDHHPG